MKATDALGKGEYVLIFLFIISFDSKTYLDMFKLQKQDYVKLKATVFGYAQL